MSSPTEAMPTTRDDAGPPASTTRHGDVLAIVAVTFVVAAVGFYFVALARFGLDVPVEDDVEFLRFLLGDEGVGWFSLHNEHRPFTARLLFAGVEGVLGRIDHRGVMWLGNACLIGVAGLASSWLPKGSRSDRIFAAATIFVLLFTLQHWQATTWATAAAQHYPMLLCALGAIACLHRPTPSRLIAAAALSALALFALGSGLFVFVVGFAMLVHARRPALAATFGGFGAVCIGFYFMGYARPDHHPSVFAAFSSPIVAFDYFCTLAGGGLSFDDTRTGWIARFAGWALLLSWAVIATGARRRSDARVFAAMTFILLTFASITATRFGFGVDQALDSRYRVYSHLLAALAFVALLESRGLKDSRNRSALALLAALLVSVASIPSAWADMTAHRSFYADNARDFARGTTVIPGPATYSAVVRRALDEGIWRLPCEAIGIEPEESNRFCR